MPTLRLGIWSAAIFFAAAPLLLGVANSPSSLGKLLEVSSYLNHGRDLMFVAIAILAVGLIDSLETLLIVRNMRRRMARIALFCSFLLLIVIFLQMFVYVFWSASIGDGISLNDIASLLTLLEAALISAALARISLVVVPGG